MCTKLKCGCGGKQFRIEKKEECLNCNHNGADTSCHGKMQDIDSQNINTGYTYDGKIMDRLDIERTQVADDQECRLGHSDDNGCHIYICVKCGEIKENIYISGA